MHAAEDAVFFFHSVADDPGSALGTFRRERADRAFEAIEDVFLAFHRDLERFVVVVSADFALRHANGSHLKTDLDLQNFNPQHLAATADELRRL